jgi:hypothetical protein
MIGDALIDLFHVSASSLWSPSIVPIYSTRVVKGRFALSPLTIRYVNLVSDFSFQRKLCLVGEAVAAGARTSSSGGRGGRSRLNPIRNLQNQDYCKETRSGEAECTREYMSIRAPDRRSKKLIVEVWAG